MTRGPAGRGWLISAALLSMPVPSLAATDEIQVYDGTLAAPGIFNLTLHNNYTPDGIRAPDFPGGIASNKSLNGVAEWAYGVTDWFEAGLYLPLYSIDERLGAKLDGAKLRALFAVPHADERTFFYGVNFEFSYNTRHWDPKRITSEIRPIVGWHLHPVDIIVNPILDTAYDGAKRLDFAPSTRVAYNFSSQWAAAVEEYGDFGSVSSFRSGGAQSHQLFGVADFRGKELAVEAGAGFGLTSASDRLTLKLILSHDLN